MLMKSLKVNTKVVVRFNMDSSKNNMLILLFSKIAISISLSGIIIYLHTMRTSLSIALAGCIALPYLYSDIKVYHSSDSKVLSHLQNTPGLNSRFYSTPWLNLGLLQSYYGSSPMHLTVDEKLVEHISYTREIHTFEDGGSYSLDWAGEPSKKILFIVPGLTGGSEAVYIKHLVLEGLNRGYHCVVMNGRGINGTPLTVMAK